MFFTSCSFKSETEPTPRLMNLFIPLLRQALTIVLVGFIVFTITIGVTAFALYILSIIAARSSASSMYGSVSYTT